MNYVDFFKKDFDSAISFLFLASKLPWEECRLGGQMIVGLRLRLVVSPSLALEAFAFWTLVCEKSPDQE